MNIQKIQNDGDVTLVLSGRLDSVTQAELMQALEDVFKTKVTNLTLELSELEYLSSAGLRVFLFARKTVSGMGGKMKLTGANASINEILQITGYADITVMRKRGKQ
jgi:anti-sigma B factor antagonist